MATANSNSHTVQVVAAPTGVPAFVPGVPFETRAMTGSYLPTNGVSMWPGAAGSAWQANPDIGGQAYHVPRAIEYSGGFSNPTARHLYVHGGGHHDSAYNGILRYDLTGSSRPGGWTLVGGSESAVGSVPSADAVHYAYGDGKAGSIHSYDNLTFDPASNCMYRFAGSYWARGTSDDRDWKFNFTTNAWVQLPSRGFNWNYRLTSRRCTRQPIGSRCLCAQALGGSTDLPRKRGAAAYRRLTCRTRGTESSIPAGSGRCTSGRVIST